VASSRLTRNARARRYLQASMEAGYTGMPAEYRDAKRSLMREHERAYPGVREHALAGARKHFDEPLGAGEREHQLHLRREAGLETPDVERIRRELEGGGSARRATQRGRSSGRSTPRAAGLVGDVATGGSGGNIVLYFIGGALFLSLIYLLLKGGESGGGKLITGVVGVVTGGVRAFIAPVDPIAHLEGALGASPITSSPSASSGTPAPSSPSSMAPAGAATDGGFLFPGSKPVLNRKDQGRDVQLTPGAGIGAPGAGDVVKVGSDPSGFGPDYPILHFTSGPYAGKQVYLGHVDSTLKAGAKFKAGQILARTSKTGHNAPPGWVEIGYAHGGVPGAFGQPSPF
jgi:hypothetical protein